MDYALKTALASMKVEISKMNEEVCELSKLITISLNLTLINTNLFLKQDGKWILLCPKCLSLFETPAQPVELLNSLVEKNLNLVFVCPKCNYEWEGEPNANIGTNKTD